VGLVDGWEMLAVVLFSGEFEPTLGDVQWVEPNILTGENRTETMSLDEEVKYSTLVETAPDPIFLIDMESGRIREVNNQATNLLGYDRTDLVGRPVQTLHPSEDLDRYAEKFEASVRREQIRFSKFDDGTQAYLVASDGKRIPVDIHARAVETESGVILFSIARNITNLKDSEDRIQQLAGELAVVNRLIRHDIRNDMTVVLGWLEQLEATLDDDHQEILGRLRRRSEAVVELTDTVRDYVEMLEDDADVTLESVLVSDIVEKETTAVRQTYDDITLSVAVPDEPVVANSMLASVFRNLLHNAVQHNDKGVTEIEVTADVHEDSVVVHVADNGPGIPDERKSDIFGKDDKGLDSSGTGIGLYLVGELVEKFGGDVSVSDNEPHGTVFSVELRRA